MIRNFTVATIRCRCGCQKLRSLEYLGYITLVNLQSAVLDSVISQFFIGGLAALSKGQMTVFTAGNETLATQVR